LGKTGSIHGSWEIAPKTGSPRFRAILEAFQQPHSNRGVAPPVENLSFSVIHFRSGLKTQGGRRRQKTVLFQDVSRCTGF